MMPDRNTKSAREYVTGTLDLLMNVLKELTQSDPALRKSYSYQTIAQVGKVIIEGSELLESMSGGPTTQPNSGGMTSVQFCQFMKEKARKMREESLAKPEMNSSDDRTLLGNN